MTTISAGISIQIQESNSQIATLIARATTAEVIRCFLIWKPRLEKQVGDILVDRIKNSAVWQSIENGQLRGELGIPLSFNLNDVLDTWRKSVTARLTAARGQDFRSVGLTIVGIRSDFADVLALSVAEYISAPSRELIPWLQWVLLEGGTTLVQDYFVDTTLNQDETARSRTGLALMRLGIGSSYSIPGFAAGTIESNFITEVIRAEQSNICARIAQVLRT